MEDVHDSVVSQDSSVHVGGPDGLVHFFIDAIDRNALLEVEEFALGDVGDGDRDGTDSVRFNGVVGPDDSELRDGVEGEGSWASGGEIVHG